MRIYVFNGDADGLCALQQLRSVRASRGAAETGDQLVTGVKRDIALLGRVNGAPGDECVVLDISLDVNRAGLMALLESGTRVQYFDHHFAGEVPRHPGLEAHLDPSPNVCTSLLVDRYLEGRCRNWAIVGTFGDSLVDEGRALAATAGFDAASTERLREIGVAINYNAYGETIADLHIPPEQLAEEMRRYTDPLEFASRSSAYRRLADGFDQDMQLARRIEPSRRVAGAIVFVLPDAAWARRVSGTIANDLAKAHANNAVAIVSPKTDGGYLVSIRVPRDCATPADAFCRRFPSGGGRRSAAGINDLPADQLTAFAEAFEAEFRAH